jgi:homoserine acetyltransferase
MAALHAAGVEATYEELDSPYGHLAPGADAAKWAPVLARFLAEL